jgi:hypothetical protein
MGTSTFVTRLAPLPEKVQYCPVEAVVEFEVFVRPTGGGGESAPPELQFCGLYRSDREEPTGGTELTSSFHVAV